MRRLWKNARRSFPEAKREKSGLCHVPAKHQRLVFKAKERDSAQTLVAAGVKSGDKMMLLLAEGEWRVRDEKELIRDVESELALPAQEVHGWLAPLQRLCVLQEELRTLLVRCFVACLLVLSLAPLCISSCCCRSSASDSDSA